jgi:hypothetical protein
MIAVPATPAVVSLPGAGVRKEPALARVGAGAVTASRQGPVPAGAGPAGSRPAGAGPTGTAPADGTERRSPGARRPDRPARQVAPDGVRAESARDDKQPVSDDRQAQQAAASRDARPAAPQRDLPRADGQQGGRAERPAARAGEAAQPPAGRPAPASAVRAVRPDSGRDQAGTGPDPVPLGGSPGGVNATGKDADADVSPAVRRIEAAAARATTAAEPAQAARRDAPRGRGSQDSMPDPLSGPRDRQASRGPASKLERESARAARGGREQVQPDREQVHADREQVREQVDIDPTSPGASTPLRKGPEVARGDSGAAGDSRPAWPAAGAGAGDRDARAGSQAEAARPGQPVPSGRPDDVAAGGQIRDPADQAGPSAGSQARAADQPGRGPGSASDGVPGSAAASAAVPGPSGGAVGTTPAERPVASGPSTSGPATRAPSAPSSADAAVPMAAANSPAAPTSEDDGADSVRVVPGIARYHGSDCILIRFLAAEDLEIMSTAAAAASGCVPCKACHPDRKPATASA